MVHSYYGPALFIIYGILIALCDTNVSSDAVFQWHVYMLNTVLTFYVQAIIHVYTFIQRTYAASGKLY